MQTSEQLWSKSHFLRVLRSELKVANFLLYGRSNATVVCDGNGGNYKFFVDIHAAADKVLNRQHR